MTEQITTEQIKMKKVVVEFFYYVPDDPNLIRDAIRCVLEDLDSALKYDELSEQVKVVDAPPHISINDAPDFLIEGTPYHPDPDMQG